MKKLIIAGIIILFIVPGVFAQFRLDLGIDVPWKFGLSTSSDSDVISNSVDVIEEIGTLPFPEAIFAYQYSFGSIPLHVGGGLRAFSFILESVAWPIVYAELDLSPIVIHANIGGLGFLFFGIANDATTSSLLIPDFHIAYKFGKTFRLGLGAIAFTGADLTEDVTPYALYLTGRFSFLFGKNK